MSHTQEHGRAVATDGRRSAVLHVGNLHYASEKAVVERVLGNRPGVLAVEANPEKHLDDIALARPPVAVQRLLFGLLAPLGRLAGYRARYPAEA